MKSTKRILENGLILERREAYFMQKCLYCGAEISEEERFCGECGMPIRESAAANSRNHPAPEPTNRRIDSILVLGMSIALGLFAVFFAAALLFGGKGNDREAEQVQELTRWDGDSMVAGSDSAGPASLQITKSGATKQDTADKQDQSGQDDSKQQEDEPKSKELVNTYRLVKQDCTWTEAKAYCESCDAHLATITSEAEYKKICDMLGDTELVYLWMGATSDHDGTWKTWITGESWTYENWYPGEPSGKDTDGTTEDYLCMWRVGDGDWTFNDMRNDLISVLPTTAGKIGFIMEFEADE